MSETRSPSPLSSEELILNNRGIVRRLARLHRSLYSSSRLPAEDVLSTGLLALVESAQRFDPTRGVDFATYAWHRVDGAIRTALAAAAREAALLEPIPTFGEVRPEDDAFGDRLGSRSGHCAKQLCDRALEQQPQPEDLIDSARLQRQLEEMGDSEKQLVGGFCEGRTLASIGRQLGLSKFQAHRRCKAALSHLRRGLTCSNRRVRKQAGPRAN
jgi:RNA polymerase sigma factor (sigma-70 family)